MYRRVFPEFSSNILGWRMPGVGVGELVPVHVCVAVGEGVTLPEVLGTLPDGDGLDVAELEGEGGMKDALTLGRREGEGEKAKVKLRVLVTATTTPCPLFDESLLNCRYSWLLGVEPFVRAGVPAHVASTGVPATSPLRAVNTSQQPSVPM
jgi:hypothetical protein